MFLITCPLDDATRLVGVHGIREHANTAHGVVTVVACPCGGAAILRHGDQVAHHAPEADTDAPSTPVSELAA